MGTSREASNWYLNEALRAGVPVHSRRPATGERGAGLVVMGWRTGPNVCGIPLAHAVPDCRGGAHRSGQGRPGRGRPDQGRVEARRARARHRFCSPSLTSRERSPIKFQMHLRWSRPGPFKPDYAAARRRINP